jgi:hypothetical protein
VFAPEKGVENPAIRRVLTLCEESGMRVIYHEDTVEVWFAPNNKRFYTNWEQLLGDAEAIFGDRIYPPGQKRGYRNGNHADSLTPLSAFGTAGRSQAETNEEILKLKREIKILERAIRVVAMQRDEWKKEADSRQATLDLTRAEMVHMADVRANLVNGGSAGADRYKQLRQTIVRRLHPDIPGTAEEKAYREVLFKTIWQEIEVLDKK